MPCCRNKNRFEIGGNGCFDCDPVRKVKGRFGLAWISESPDCPCPETIGWQVEFLDTPSKVEQKCKEMVRWINCPPLPRCDPCPPGELCFPPEEMTKRITCKPKCACSKPPPKKKKCCCCCSCRPKRCCCPPVEGACCRKKSPQRQRCSCSD